ncbi:MAG: hypothetical protein ACRDZ7_13530 [Acidimicrobiia bacterium]
MDGTRRPEDLSEDERQRLHRAHQRLRNTSQSLEALTVIEKVKGRWTHTPAPPEALEAAQLALHEACQELWRVQRDLLGLGPPAGPATGDE